MNSKIYLAGFCAIQSGLMLLSACSPTQQETKEKSSTKLQRPEKKPNILWISCEDISAHLGCYGDSLAQTPNIDQLAQEGMKFNNVFTSAPVSAPCRSGIITGMYQTSIGTHHMRTSHGGRTGELPTPYASVPPPYVKAFTEYLRANGYYCTNNSKTDYQFTLGQIPSTIWDECSNSAHYENRADKNQPFFAVFNYTVTHESKNWPDPEVTDPKDVTVPPYYPDTEIVRKDIARLYDNIAKLDTIVGHVLSELEEKGLAENTIVFFWSDHGDGLPRAKRWPYDSGTKIPLIVRWPGSIEPGSINNELISSIDFGPTVLSLAGVDIPTHMEGRAFLGSQATEEPEYVFSARDRFDESYDMVRSVRGKQFRYCRNYYPNQPYVLWVPYRNRSGTMKELLRLHAEGKLKGAQKNWFISPRPAEELYDCEKDPHNINNLAKNPEFKDVLNRMSEAMDEWQLKTGDMGKLSEEIMLAQVWPEGTRPETSRPWLIPNTEGNRGQQRIQNEVDTLTAPATISLYCATQGASFSYTLDEGENPAWKLYYKPIRFDTPGEYTLRATAVRYGYLESEVIEHKIIVK